MAESSSFKGKIDRNLIPFLLQFLTFILEVLNHIFEKRQLKIPE